MGTSDSRRDYVAVVVAEDILAVGSLVEGDCMVPEAVVEVGHIGCSHTD